MVEYDSRAWLKPSQQVEKRKKIELPEDVEGAELEQLQGAAMDAYTQVQGEIREARIDLMNTPMTDEERAEVQADLMSAIEHLRAVEQALVELRHPDFIRTADGAEAARERYAGMQWGDGSINRSDTAAWGNGVSERHAGLKEDPRYQDLVQEEALAFLLETSSEHMERQGFTGERTPDGYLTTTTGEATAFLPTGNVSAGYGTILENAQRRYAAGESASTATLRTSQLEKYAEERAAEEPEAEAATTVIDGRGEEMVAAAQAEEAADGAGVDVQAETQEQAPDAEELLQGYDVAAERYNAARDAFYGTEEGGGVSEGRPGYEEARAELVAAFQELQAVGAELIATRQADFIRTPDGAERSRRRYARLQYEDGSIAAADQAVWAESGISRSHNELGSREDYQELMNEEALAFLMEVNGPEWFEAQGLTTERTIDGYLIDTNGQVSGRRPVQLVQVGLGVVINNAIRRYINGDFYSDATIATSRLEQYVAERAAEAGTVVIDGRAEEVVAAAQAEEAATIAIAGRAEEIDAAVQAAEAQTTVIPEAAEAATTVVQQGEEPLQQVVAPREAVLGGKEHVQEDPSVEAVQAAEAEAAEPAIDPISGPEQVEREQSKEHVEDYKEAVIAVSAVRDLAKEREKAPMNYVVRTDQLDAAMPEDGPLYEIADDEPTPEEALRAQIDAYTVFLGHAIQFNDAGGPRRVHETFYEDPASVDNMFELLQRGQVIGEKVQRHPEGQAALVEAVRTTAKKLGKENDVVRLGTRETLQWAQDQFGATMGSMHRYQQHLEGMNY